MNNNMREKTLVEYIYDLPLNSDQRNELFDKIQKAKDKQMWLGIGIAGGAIAIASFIVNLIVN